MMTSCSDEKVSSDEELEQALSSETVRLSTEVDAASDDVDFIVENVYQLDVTDTAGRSAVAIPDFLPDCVTITKTITSTSIAKTVDFGTGCTLPSGNEVSGIIYMNYNRDVDALTRTIEVGLEDFYFNDIAIEGSRTVTRMASNADGNPEANILVDWDVAWPDGTTASRDGTKVREWIAGVGTGTWADNVFLITGSYATTFRSGNTYSRTINDALRRELACNFLVSGNVSITYNTFSGVLDFGDGSCDNEAVWTNAAGETTTVYLD